MDQPIPDLTKREQLAFRCTEDQRRLIERAAIERRKRVSEFCREIVVATAQHTLEERALA